MKEGMLTVVVEQREGTFSISCPRCREKYFGNALDPDANPRTTRCDNCGAELELKKA